VTIPIRNLYYLFCYAWGRFPEGGHLEVGVDDCPDLPNLFAKLLVSGVNGLLRRGLDRGYVSFVEETRAPRGRMLIDEIVKTQTLRRGAVVCALDELTPDVTHNQILKATARRLTRAHGIEAQLRHELGLVVRRMGGVSDIPLSAQLFRQVQLSRNTGRYLPLLKLCELVHRALMPDEGGAGSRFADILRDDVTMSAVFEEFLRSFFQHEQRTYRVAVDTLTWAGFSPAPEDWAYLPSMMTDLTLTSAQRTIVMDAKFYAEALTTSYGAKKVHSSNLYQLFAYLQHTALKRPGVPVEGVLIYPTNGYELSGYPIRIVTVNLAAPWREIHERLLALLDKPYAAQAA
jgi:5-methylcytosine-specific restriction enzyme subunit McrC